MMLRPGFTYTRGPVCAKNLAMSKDEQQRFNLRSAGVSSSLLFVSVAGAYSPSLFQHTFGASKLVCVDAQEGMPCSYVSLWR